MTDVPVPRLRHNDLLIEIRKTAIYETDVHIYNWDEWPQKAIPIPMIVGYEYVGKMAGIDQEAKGFKVGDHISDENHTTCDHCRNCRGGRTRPCRNMIGVDVSCPGCFVRHLVTPASGAFKILDSTLDDLTSIFDLFDNTVYTALLFGLAGKDVLVSGAGSVGIITTAMAKHAGARNVVVTDVNECRLGLAYEMGIIRAVNAAGENLDDVVTELNMTEDFDVGLGASGVPPALRTIFDTMNHGGHAVMPGVSPSDTSIDWTGIIFRGLFIKGIYGREMSEA